MKLNINWKAGILSAIVAVVIGIGLYIFVGSNIDYKCKNTTPNTTGCLIYHSVDSVISGYADIFRTLSAPRCVGGKGPDDCIGPDAGIMLVTLLAIGFIVGNLIWRKNPGQKSKHS